MLAQVGQQIVWAQRETPIYLLTGHSLSLHGSVLAHVGQQIVWAQHETLNHLLDTTGGYMALCSSRWEIDHFYYSDTGG